MGKPKPRTSLLALVIGILLIGGAGYFLFLLFMPLILKGRESDRRSVCVNNLRQMGLVMALYANENNDMFPPLDNRPGNLMFDGNVIFPEYLTNINFLGCPGDPKFDPRRSFRLARTSAWHEGLPVGEPHADCIDNTSYGYTPWVIREDSEAQAALAAITQLTESPGDAWRDAPLNLASFGFTGSGNSNSDVLLRLGHGAEVFYMPDEFSRAENQNTAVRFEGSVTTVPIVWDQISTDIAEFSHVPAGQNVLFLDGHVEFIRYTTANTQFPTTPLFAALNSQFTPARDDPSAPWGDCP